MRDVASLFEQTNRASVNLLLTDVDIALTYINIADTSKTESRAKQAVRDARRAYDVICEKRPRFYFSEQEAHELERKLVKLKDGLKRHGEPFCVTK